MGFTEKTNYLKDSKEILRNALQDLGADIDAETPFRQYMKDNIIDTIWNNAKKVSAEGSNIMLQGAAAGKLAITPKGNTSQENYEGKNLCPTNLLPITANGLTISKDANGNIIINGTPNYSSGYKSFTIGESVPVPANKYSVSLDTKVQGIGFKSGLSYGDMSMSDTNNTTTTTLPVDGIIAPVINIRYDVGTLENYILNPQIEIGTPTDYEPYTGGQPAPNPDYPQDIKVVTGENDIIIRGKNLFMNLDTETKNGVTLTRNANGTYSLAGTTTKTTEFIIYGNVLPNGTYTLSCNKRIANCKVIVQDYNNYTWKKNILYLSWINNTNLTDTRTISSYTGNRTRYLLEVNAGTYNESDIKIQLEQGSTATTYEPYIEPIEKQLNLGNIELAKIGDYSDLIFKNEKSNPYYDNTLVENAWYKKKYIGKITLNGTENPTLNIDSANTTRCYYNYDLLEENTIQNQGLCNRLSYVSNWSQDVEGFYYNNNSKKLIFRMLKATIGTTKTSVNAWLSNNPTKFYYVLATPTDSQITDTTLINQLESLNRTIIPAQTIIIKTESNEENARLIVNAKALQKI